MHNAGVVADGLAFPEGLRWHGEALWFSDFYTHRVNRVGSGGTVDIVCEVAGQPSGLGWLPDGDMLVVSMVDRRLLRWNGDRLGLHADLSSHAPFHANDMAVDAEGRAYVGNFGFDPWSEDMPQTTCLLMVPPAGGSPVRVADELAFPNGIAISADGCTLIVAESTAARLTAFSIGPDGTLSGRRVFAETPGMMPDGIAYDRAGTLWVTTMQAGLVLGIDSDGRERHRIEIGAPCWSCAAGPDSLYVATSQHWHKEACRELRSGQILALDLP